MRRTVEHVAVGFGASASVDFRLRFTPLVNDAEQTAFAALICEDLVGAANVNREPALVMASEDFADMLKAVPGCYLLIGNGDREGDCEVHNPMYDFNDEALPLGASFFARVVERKLC